MNFKEAYELMKDGKKVRRKGWIGYWFIEDDKVKIHLKDGNIKFNNFTQETIANTLEEDWEVVGEKKYWEPKYNETYYEMYNSGIYSDTNLDTNADKFRFSIGNYFKTKEEAKYMVEKLKVIHELQKFAYENNQKEIDWKNFSQNKFYLTYDYEDEEICIDYYKRYKNAPINIYFTSEELAKKAIEEIGEDRIKKYYFDMEE